MKLSDRMKKYEDSYRNYLPANLPVIIRVDGKNFSKLTSKLTKPWDLNFIQVMDRVALKLCSKIQNAKFAYIQSDEISILINSYESIDSGAWFDNCLSKIISVSAATASSCFTANSALIFETIKEVEFDSRILLLPREEVNNYFLWRQTDATRNSIQMLARSHFSHAELNKKSTNEMQDMIFKKTKINWNNLQTSLKRGRCVVKDYKLINTVNPKTKDIVEAVRSEWVVDNEIPIFSQDKNYVEKFNQWHVNGKDKTQTDS